MLLAYILTTTCVSRYGINDSGRVAVINVSN